MSLSVTEAMAGRLAGDSDVTDIRSDRYFSSMSRVPQGTALPYQVGRAFDTSFEHHLDDTADTAVKRFVLDSYGNTDAEARDLAAASYARLNNFKGTITNSGKSLVVQRVMIEDDNEEAVPVVGGSDAGPRRIRQEYIVTYEL